MKTKEFTNLWKESLKSLFTKPFLFIPGFFLIGIVLGISTLGKKISYSLQTTPSNIIWVASSTLALLISFSLISSFLIILATNAIEKKKWNFLLGSRIKTGFPRNFAVLLFFLILFNLINLTLFLFTKAMILSQKYLILSEGVFRLLSTLIYFVWIAGVLIFFCFSGFFAVSKNQRLVIAVKNSASLVKSEYPAVLSLTLIFFALFFFSSTLPEYFSNFVEYIILVPLLFVLMTRFILVHGK